MNTLIVILTLITLYLAYRRVKYWKKETNAEKEWAEEYSKLAQDRLRELNTYKSIIPTASEILKKIGEEKRELQAQLDTALINIETLEDKLKATRELATYWETLYMSKHKSKNTSKKK